MNKKMIVMAAAALTAATFVSTAAEARGRGGFRIAFGGHHNDRFWSGIKPSFNHGRRDEETYYERRRYKPAARPVEQASTVKFADGKGRAFDPTSQVWFDGKGQCFTGDKPFVFKNGAWFYGNARWYEVNGAWQTAATEAPVGADCTKVPAFASRLAPAEKPAKVVQQPAKALSPVKTAETAATDKPAAPVKATGCTKYFPSVGETLPVPCTE